MHVAKIVKKALADLTGKKLGTAAVTVLMLVQSVCERAIAVPGAA